MNNSLFIIGGQRSGTTFLYNLLNQHPKILFKDNSGGESRFFIRNGTATAQDFVDSFDVDARQKVVLAEKSTSYFEHPQALAQINKEFPQADIVFVYRNPIQRCISNYFYSVKNKIESRTLEDVFILKKRPPKLNVKVSVDPFNYIERSRLSIIYERVNSLFGKRVIWVNFDLLIRDPKQSANYIFDRMGLERCEIKNNVGTNNALRGDISQEVQDALRISLAEEVLFYEKMLLDSTDKIL